MGEKFAANPVTGSGSMTVPIATSPGRSGFGPQLGLSYDSGAGNGPFGFGWSLSLPSITRKTDKGLARYRDWSTDPLEADVFLLSGAEDLVPVFRKDKNGSWLASQPAGHGLHRDPLDHWILDRNNQFVIHEDLIDGYRVRRYRPRIEGLFARIERWQWIPSAADPRPEALQRADRHWRSISKDNILTIYGADASSRIADPEDPERIFSWLICESRDDKGNGIRYLYKAEDGSFRNDQQDPFLAAHQRNRFKGAPGARTYACTAQHYLKRILYGNLRPLLNPQGQRPRNLADLPNPPSDEAKHWLFEVRFDYGELDENNPTTVAEKAWFYRPDAFSSYRSGFEVRTCRRCERVLMLHHIPDQAATADRPFQKGYEGVVRSTEFSYDDELNPTIASKPIYSFLSQVEQRGWNQANGTTTTKSLPPLEFRYSQPVLGEEVAVVDLASLENLPMGLDGGSYRWVDLHGEGLPGILTEQAGSWFYKRNLSPISQRLQGATKAEVASFAPLEMVASRPNVSLAAGAQILDLAGDGLPDVVSFSGPAPGLYGHDEAEGWQPWRPFRQLPNVNFNDSNLRFIDLDGDGHADLLISEGDVFVWHRSLEEQGFEGAQRVPLPWDEEKGPRVVFADGSESIHLADMSGDGLADVVRIRAGLQGNAICYWPNLGYGRFGAKVTMDNAPLFDHPELFDPKRLLLADIDGSGSTDLIYLHAEGVRLYFNQAGNGWSEAVPLKVFPPIHSAAQVTTVDLLGNGTACLVWSSPLAGDSGRQMRYVPLMAEGKPHLLNTSINNLGAETRVQYCSSLRFYLEDKLNGKPWITRLPFPVHVVERVETIDHISRNRFVSRHAYHHGFFDGEEREFRGFGMVEQWDTEQFAALAAGNVAADNIASASHVPPVHTKTWFHTGVYLGGDHVSNYFAGLLNATDQGEYFREPGLSDTEARDLLLPDTELPAGLSLEEEREACRALKGSMLRQEVYADDAGPNATHEQIERAQTPYTVTEQNFTIRALQPRGANRHAVFFTHAREAISYHYERNPADPRIQHALTLEVDVYGNVLKQAAIGYGRRQQIRIVDQLGNAQLVPNPGLTGLQAGDQAKQTTPLLTYTENRVTNAIESPDTHRIPLPCEALTFELTGYIASGSATGPASLVRRFQASDFVESDPAAPGRLRHKFAAPEVAYEAIAAGNQRRRPIEWLRTLYRRDDLASLLPLGELQSLGLPGESYKLAFTPGLLTQVFQRTPAGQLSEALLPNPSAVLAGQAGNRGGYLQSQTLKADGRFPTSDFDNHWWIPSGESFFSANPTDSAATESTQARLHFFLPRRYRDPFGQDDFVDFDVNDLLMVETRDALGNRVSVEANDCRVLQPRLVSDPNRNQTEVAFDTLGMVVGTAVMGKPLPAPVEGDTLSGFAADLTQAQVDAFFDAADPHTNAPGLLSDATTRIVYDLDRFRRTQQANPGDSTKWQPACAATLARETHASAALPLQGLKIQLSFSYSDGFGREIQKKIQAEPGPLVEGGPVVNLRWVGSGWTIFNNKGKPVRQYEPFFSATHGFEFGVQVGVSPVLFYDPAERVVATLHPNHTYEKVVFGPWQQTTYDVNDTCAARNAQTGDPRTDPDIGGFDEEYFKTQPATWQTWHAQRIGGGLGQDERNAALRAEAHADTPTTAHFDALGRPLLTVARNRVVCPGHDLDGTEESFASRVELDIEGNQRAVIDAKDRIVMRYAYDMLGSRIHQLSMEAGARWMLNDVAGKPIRAWDSRGHNFTTTYDALRRPLEQTVRGTIANGEAASDPRTLNRDLLVDKIEYGESLANAEALNLRTRIYRHSDSAGVATNARLAANGTPIEAHDFKGNLLRSTRRLVTDYTAIPDWLLPAEPQLDAEFFESSTRYDALNRPIQSIAPHSSLSRPGHPNKFNVIQHVFNEANLLERVDVWLERAAEPAGLLNPAAQAPSPVGVANIDYDAKGQRTLIDYKTSDATVIRTTYAYDRETFRLMHLFTRRGVDPTTAQGVAFTDDCENPNPPPATIAAPEQPPAGKGCGLQNLHYTYDPAGNITHIQDDAQQTIYFRNKRVEPSNDYTYDALYRLIQASGREHLGQGGAPIAHSHNDASRVGLLSADATGRFGPNDGNAMGTYIERYVYDSVGNFLQMQHRGSDPAQAGWTRAYDYLEASLIENGSGGAPLKTSNRLTRTMLNPNGANPPQVEPYEHDAHGNMVRMPHLGGGLAGPNMHWDYKDQLRQTDLGGGGAAWYVYDSSGQRVRKVWEKSSGLTEERIYLGGFEIFRRHGGPIGANTATLERETLHAMDDKQRIALVETLTLDAADNDQAPPQLIRYQFGNHLGSSSLELDQQAQIITHEEYAPYGSSTYQAVRSQTETAKRYRYTGMERDEETRLSYHTARYYAPWLGGWASSDPAGLKAGLNLFNYANCNPLKFSDKSGRDPSSDEVLLFRLVYHASVADPAQLYSMYQSNSQFSQMLGQRNISGPLSQEAFIGRIREIRQQWIRDYGVDIGERVEQAPQALRSEPIRFEEDTTPVLMAAPDGSGIIGPRNVVEQRIARLRFQQQLQVGDNIRGGIFGAIGYMVDGDRGSYAGAAVDGLAMAASATSAHRQYNQSMARSAPPQQGMTPETVTRSPSPAAPPTAQTVNPGELVARARAYFQLPPSPTSSNTRIVGVLLTGQEQMFIHSGEFGGPWGGTHRGGVPRGRGYGFTSGGPSQGNIATHVEGHAAAIMHQRGLLSATLVVESDPCGICSRDLSDALPPGASLTIISPGHGTTYVRSSHALR
jgi:RHS repeat-associated protein